MEKTIDASIRVKIQPTAAVEAPLVEPELPAAISPTILADKSIDPLPPQTFEDVCAQPNLGALDDAVPEVHSPHVVRKRHARAAVANCLDLLFRKCRNGSESAEAHLRSRFELPAIDNSSSVAH